MALVTYLQLKSGPFGAGEIHRIDATPANFSTCAVGCRHDRRPAPLCFLKVESRTDSGISAADATGRA
jgi:hypothetical protein